MNHYSYKIKRLTAVAMFCALAYVCMLFIKIPVQFLTLDVKDSLIILCSLLFGPISGISVAIIVPFLELITISGTGVYGFIMNVLSSVVFSSVAGLIYYYRKSMMGAVVGLVTGVCAVTAVMLLANLLITPYYLGGSPKDVAAMIPTVLLPFNLVKATLNAAIVLLLYKPISTVLKKMGFLKSSTSQSQSSLKSPLRSVIVTSAAIVIIAISLLVVFFVLKK
jgi:riboflavin transporter FmnP